MAAIRQKPRPTVTHFIMRLVQLRRRRRRATRRWYPVQPLSSDRKENHAVAAPSAAGRCCIAQRLRCPASHVDSLELVLGEKAEVAAIRRPEGGVRLFGP